MRGYAFLCKQDHDRAIADFDCAIALDPSSWRVLPHRATIHLRMGNHDAAIADFDRLIAIDPASARALIGRGAASRAKGEHGRAESDLTLAIDHLDRLIARFPDYAPAYADRGLANILKGDLAGALADHEAATRLDARLMRALYGRGLVKTRLGDGESGRRDMAQAKAAEPEVDGLFSPFGLHDG